MEISDVRRRVQAAMVAARDRARQRRQMADEAETTYAAFLDHVATPLARQVVNALRAEGYAFTVSTPGRSLRVTSDHARDDFIELDLRTDGDRPQVVGHIRRTRGSRTLDEELVVKPGAMPKDISKADVLEFFVRALEPWLER